MKREDNGLVGREQAVKLLVAQTVRVLALRLELHRLGACLVFGATWAGHVLAGDGTSESGKVFRFLGGEQVSVQLGGEKESSISQIVTSDGFVSIPAGGTVNILGKSLQEATDALSAKIKEAQGLRSPQISIAIISIPTRRIYMQGEVVHPQSLLLPQDHEYCLAAALAEAGGLTEDADLSRIKVVRSNPKASPRVEMVDASAFGRAGRDDLGPLLRSGDVVIVPRAETFAITGEVNKQGFTSRKDMKTAAGLPIRLSLALAAAGGLKPTADRNTIRVLRIASDGTRRMTTYDLEAALEKGDLQQDPVLQDGDQVMVAASEGITVTGQVRAPGVYYPVSSPVRISRLIAMAGGFEKFASRSAVTIVFKDKPGQPVKVDMKKVFEGVSAAAEDDVSLRSGDMVFVSGGL